MPDVKQQLEHALERATHDAPPEDFDRFVTYRERRRQNQRVAAGAFALVLAVAVIGSALAVLRTSDDGRPGSPGNVVEVPTIQGPCFPPDQCWDQDVYLVRPDGTGVARIGFGPERDIAYSWSPDGTRIAFAAAAGVEDGERESTAGIFTAAVDGSDVKRLTDSAAINVFPVFSPDGTRIAFQSDRAGTHDIWVMDVDGSDPVRLTDFPDGPEDEYTPTWSPDSTRIAFVRGEIPSGGPGELWVMDADGSNARVQLAEPLADFPSWSPDGTQIAFETGDFPEVRVAVLDLGTGVVRDLGTGFHPIWSPDGSRLAVSIPEGGFTILEPNAPEHRLIVHETGWAAAWSPDGQQLVFNDVVNPPEPDLQAPPPGEVAAGFTMDGTPWLVVRHADGTLTAGEAISPHLAAGDVRQLLGWCASSRTFDDPFAGARFDEYGRYISGPSPGGLVPLSVELLSEDPPTFRLGESLPAIPRDPAGEQPTGAPCMDLEATPLLAPGIAAGGLTPEELASSSPSSPPDGTRWSVQGTLFVGPDGEARLCATYAAGVCEAGARVIGPVPDGEDELVVEGTWYVIVQDGELVDPIRAR